MRRYGCDMNFEEFTNDVARCIEAVGVAILVVGSLLAFLRWARQVVAHTPDSLAKLQEGLGRALLLGLEVLIIADIIRTIIVDPSVESVIVLGLIVATRILLSFSIEAEINGAWPWNRARLTQERIEESSAGADG